MARFTPQIREGSVGMTEDVTAGGPSYLKNESAVASNVGINIAREYSNWGGEFVDDAIRFGEQPFQLSDDWPGRTMERGKGSVLGGTPTSGAKFFAFQLASSMGILALRWVKRIMKNEFSTSGKRL